MRLRPAMQAAIGRIAEGRFLTGGRVQVYGLAAFLIYCGLALGAYRTQSWFVNKEGLPVASDFVAFWAAGFLAAAGEAGKAYDWSILREVAFQTLGHPFDGKLPWPYPPPFFFLVAPLAMLPYLQAWLVWIAASAAFCLASFRLILPRLALPVLLAAPGSLWCALVGQNGFLTAGLMAATLALLDRRPWLAGVFLGLLTYKPHFGILFPLFLILERRWASFIGAGLVALAMAGASLAVFGLDAWKAFVAAAPGTADVVLLSRGMTAFKVQSVYAVFYQLGGSSGLALLLHFALAACICAALLWLWRGPTTLAVRGAALVAASFLMTPYAYIYDTTILTVAALLLARDGMDRGFRQWDRLLLLIACLLPGLFDLLGSITGPLASLLLLWLAARRAAPAGPRLSLALERRG